MTAICHWTQQEFTPVVTTPCNNPAYVWVECEICDAMGRVVGEAGYDRNSPSQHLVTQEIAAATNSDDFGTLETCE